MKGKKLEKNKRNFVALNSSQGSLTGLNLTFFASRTRKITGHKRSKILSASLILSTLLSESYSRV